MLFVGSCFADSIGQRFVADKFRATVNPFGVMYNPVSILHTVKRCEEIPHVAVFTLGTNHVYILKRDGRNREQLPKTSATVVRGAPTHDQ
jgi:hypothetical protein